jgi:WD40 repeat protein
MFVLRLGKVMKINHLAFAPDGRSIVGCANLGVYLWKRLGDGESPEHVPKLDWVTFARFTPDGRELFAGGGYNLVRMDVETGHQTVVPLWDHRHVYFDLAPNGKRFVVAQLVLTKNGHATRIACRTTRSTKAKPIWEYLDCALHTERPQYLPGGKRFVRLEETTGYRSRQRKYQLVTYDSATGTAINRSETFTEELRHSLLAPDGRWFAGVDSARIHLWPIDPRTTRPARITNDTKKPFSNLAFHPSGQFIATVSNEKPDKTAKPRGLVKFFDTATGELMRTFTWDIGRLQSVCFSADGTLAAAGSATGKVVVWDVDE